MSRKTERLVNLTIALLATKRFLTKSEIFRTVDGYEGSPESKERMFERDKDDLRNLGITIEVGTFDPLFEDEAGYRIKDEDYQFQLGELSNQEITLLSLAAEAWRGAALDSMALSALVKLRAIGIESDLQAIPEVAPAIEGEDQNLPLLIASIISRNVLTFSYLNESLESHKRAIEAYAIASKFGHWYLVGHDLDRGQIRSFRLDRMIGSIEKVGRSKAFEIPNNFQIGDHLSDVDESQSAMLFLRDDRALTLRSRAKVMTSLVAPEGWQAFEISYGSVDRFIEEVLWFGDDVVLVSPPEMREKLVNLLKIGVDRYG